LLEEEQIGEADYFVACTKDDENNIVTGLQAAKLGASHIQTVINKTDYDAVLEDLKSALGVELVVSPRVATSDEVMRIISTEPYIELAVLPRGGGKILEFRVHAKSSVVGETVRSIAWPERTVAVALHRKFEARVPRADDEILAGDRVVVITKADNERDLLNLFRKA
jgi:trk system potassium uptake protein TrkA